MHALLTLAAFVVALGVLIVVHEAGHYFVARRCGVKVLRFSVGFGRPLWSRHFGVDRTEFVVAAFPLGGYVKMVDEREGDVPAADLPRAFNRQTVGRRMAIVAAGPAANFLLAILLYWLLFMIGVPGIRPLLGEPPAGSAAAAAQIRAGEAVTAVAGTPVATWQELRWQLLQQALKAEAVDLEVEDGGRVALRRLDLSGVSATDLEGDFVRGLGLILLRPAIPAQIGRLVEGGVAGRAGMQVGDRVLAAAGRETAVWEDLVAIVRDHPGKGIDLRILRGETELSLTLTPEAVSEGGRRVGKIGAAPQVDEAALARLRVEVRHTPLPALAEGVRKTWDTSLFTLKMLGRMLLGQVSWKNISGPVTIADYAGQTASMGWVPYLGFLALISISLGVLNLLPIPLLDGGHLMYHMLEIFKGSPLSDRTMEWGQKIGIALLAALMFLAIFNDLNRYLSG